MNLEQWLMAVWHPYGEEMRQAINKSQGRTKLEHAYKTMRAFRWMVIEKYGREAWNEFTKNRNPAVTQSA